MTPLTIDFLKELLVIDSSRHDGTLRALLDDAIAVWEQRTGRMIKSRSLTLTREYVCDVVLPHVPVASVSSVQYVDDDTGVLTTVDASNWYTSNVLDPFVSVRWKTSASLPSNVRRGTVAYNYVVGSSYIPAGQARAIAALVGHWFNNPEAAAPVEMKPVPYSWEALVSAYSVKAGAW